MNYKEKYDKIACFMHNHPQLLNALIRTNRLLTKIIYFSYPVFLLGLYLTEDKRLLKMIFVPAISFGTLTIVRKLINRKRPYERWEITPLIKKNKQGQSMPSRHVFSITIIALAFYQVIPLLGIATLFLSILMAVIRVIGGVHYPSDVIVGALLGWISSLFLITY